MKQPSPELRALFEEARRYEEGNDHYNAVKLYKRIVKEARYWAAPHIQLGNIYKYRQEWKPALYYNKKAISLDVGNKTAWWNVGIAATALKKQRLARSVWGKFGLAAGQKQPLKPVSVRLAYKKQFEIMWVQREGPAQGIIRNIPHPGSGRRFGDTVLIDNVIRGYHTSDYYRLPIYDELGVFKCSHYLTFSCLLQTPAPKDVHALQQLCREEKLGFEVWANAARSLAPQNFKGRPEYHFYKLESESELLVAIAAPGKQEALSVLEAWKVISLKHYTGFQAHQVC